MLKQLQEPQLTATKKFLDTLTDHLQQYEASVANAYMVVTQFRVRKTRDDRAVVNISYSDLMEPTLKHLVVNAIVQSMLATGYEYKAGSPPASDMERKNQLLIDALKAQLGKK